MPQFEKHVFVCTFFRESDPAGCCATKGSVELRDYLKTQIKSLGLQSKIRINAAGCLDQCKKGPAVVIYPEGVWYQIKTLEEAQALLESHLLQGKIIESLLIDQKTKDEVV